MPHLLRAHTVPAFAAALLIGPGLAAASFTESLVRSYADYDDDVTAVYDVACSPFDGTDPVEDGCGCDPFVSHPANELCDIGGRLFRRSTVPDEGLSADSNVCEVAACGVGATALDALALARSDYGYNFVDVFSNSFLNEVDLRRSDEASAVSRWTDDLTLTTTVPGLANATLRATFRVRGGWENAPCLTVAAELRQLTETPPFVSDSYVGTSQTVAWDTVCNTAVPGGPESLPGYDAEDAPLDHSFQVEIPLPLPSTVRVFAELRAHAERGDDVLLFGPEGGFIGERTEGGGVEMRVERLEVPPGVEIASAADALDAYHVPEPDAGAGAAIALAARLALRRRRPLAPDQLAASMRCRSRIGRARSFSSITSAR